MTESSYRFTAAEGGARLAAVARRQNTIVTEHSAFVALRLLHEEAYKIRGLHSQGAKRSVYVTRETRVSVVEYDVRLLTDLSVSAVRAGDTTGWAHVVENTQVIVCTSDVISEILQSGLLIMADVNVLVLDSCHLIHHDDNLRYIMKCYKETDEDNRPRILALTYPLFSSMKSDISANKNDECKNDVANENEKNKNENDKNSSDLENDQNRNDDANESDKNKSDVVNTNEDDIATTVDTKAEEVTKSEEENTNENSENDNIGEENENDKPETNEQPETMQNIKNDIFKIGTYENLDDFDMYEKLEWKIDVLEEELCCKADLADDIDGIKRASTTVSKPMELIVEYSSQSEEALLPEDYVELDNYMRSTVQDLLKFFDDHRYDPTEIYGEDLYEELKKIPDPTIDPKTILYQFLYVLDQLGPYCGDKAAFSLLTKLEKLRIKVPYERHFLLLCLCTSVFVKIRCYADLIFSKYDNEWTKIQRFSTPKVLRFAEILEKFKPPPSAQNKNDDDPNGGENKNDNTINTNDKAENDSHKNDLADKDKLLSEIDKCDFTRLGDRIEDRINTMEGNLKDLDDYEPKIENDAIVKEKVANENDNDKNENEDERVQKENNEGKNENDHVKSENDEIKNEYDQTKNENDESKNKNDEIDNEIAQNPLLGFVKRMGPRPRGRRVPRNNTTRAQQLLQNPDALCGIVFMKEPFMAKILFNLIVELSRSHESLSFIRGQYCAQDKDSETERQRRTQEDVLKKFRMHECNLLLATPSLEEGVELPRCNLVLRWDVPPHYRSHSLCRGRARAPRASCVLLSHGHNHNTAQLMHNVATYTELDQIVSRKCGCGIQDEPPQSEEDHADTFTPLIQAYTPICEDLETSIPNKTETNSKTCFTNTEDKSDATKNRNDEDQNRNRNDQNKNVNRNDATPNSDEHVSKNDIKCNKCSNKTDNVESVCVCDKNENDIDKNRSEESDEPIAKVDMNTAIALINRYCGKLPSDTFTRLAPQWCMEEVSLPHRNRPGEKLKAFICTLRLPLNCPVKYNIVGHPMPTRSLARRITALMACRALHKGYELDHRLAPIGKENFKAAELDIGEATASDPARPGTTKRRQYYYKKTADVFTDCEPIVDSTEEDLKIPFSINNIKIDSSGKSNQLYSISCHLKCGLPERYNTRGRRLHLPQTASQALAVLMSQAAPHRLRIPSFPVYTRSGEVRVSVERIEDADVRVTQRRAKVIRRFMRFVFSEVLRVRRRGMTLSNSTPDKQNNYYVVPTIKSTRPDGSIKIDVDWDFVELIYRHTEERKHADVELNIPWHLDDEEWETSPYRDKKSENKNDQNGVNDSNENTNNVTVNCSENTNDLQENKTVVDQTSNDQNENVQENRTDVDENKIDDIKNVNESVKENDATSKNDNQTKSQLEKGEVYSSNTQVNTQSYPRKGDKFRNNEKVDPLPNPHLKKGETFVFDPDKYREAVVTPWYRNQDQPQFFLVAEICWSLTPESAFPSATHTTFRSYYKNKYGVDLTQPNQPLLDVDHTSARLNLLTPRYVNRKGVALPVSSERTRRAKRDRLDQKQILVPELCSVHPFPAPLWFATVALPCVLYRINALLIADEIRVSVAREAGLGDPDLPGDHFQWPPLDFGWSLAEVLSADAEKNKESAKEENKDNSEEAEDVEQKDEEDSPTETEATEKTVNDILQEKEDAENGFEIGMWSNEMASSIPSEIDFAEPLPPNVTLCTSNSGGKNWCEPAPKPRTSYNASRAYSIADSDCSYMSSDMSDDTDLSSGASDDDTDTSGFCSNKQSNASMGVRIEYKTSHEAEAVDVSHTRPTSVGPTPDATDDQADVRRLVEMLADGCAPTEYIEKFHNSVEKHKKTIVENNLLVKKDDKIIDILPEPSKDSNQPKTLETNNIDEKLQEVFPYGTEESTNLLKANEITLKNLEKHKRILLAELKKSMPEDEIKKLQCFSMVDVDIDAIDNNDDDFYAPPEEVQSKKDSKEFTPYYEEGKGDVGGFDFDYQPDLNGHPGPSPSVILQALTMSNANDGINLERLETVGDSFLKFAITAYLYCRHRRVHEGKLSHMRSKQVSNLNLYRLGVGKRLGTLMIATKFEPHDNWLPPAHSTVPMNLETEEQEKRAEPSPDGCFIPYNLITQHSIPDKSIADCVEALIGAYLIECGPRGALLFMAWLGIRVLPRLDERDHKNTQKPKNTRKHRTQEETDTESDLSEDDNEDSSARDKGTKDHKKGPVFGALKPPPSPLLRYVPDPEGELQQMLSGYDKLEETLQYRFRDRSLLLQALTHASHESNRLTDCYQRLEFLGDAILDYLITRHLYEDGRGHSPGALTDLRSALVNNTIFATLAVRHGFHRFFRHMSPGLHEVLTKYVKIQEENGHSISEEHYLIQEDEWEQAEDVEVPKALGDLFESIAGAIFLDSGMSLGAVWRGYGRLMKAELEAFSAAAPKSPVRELLEAQPDTAKFGKPERLADGRRVRVSVEVFGRGCFKGVGRNYRIAKGTAARCALRHLRRDRHNVH